MIYPPRQNSLGDEIGWAIGYLAFPADVHIALVSSTESIWTSCTSPPVAAKIDMNLSVAFSMASSWEESYIVSYLRRKTVANAPHCTMYFMCSPPGSKIKRNFQSPLYHNLCFLARIEADYMRLFKFLNTVKYIFSTQRAAGPGMSQQQSVPRIRLAAGRRALNRHCCFARFNSLGWGGIKCGRQPKIHYGWHRSFVMVRSPLFLSAQINRLIHKALSISCRSESLMV